MKTYKDLENFNNWSDADKDQLSIAVIKGLLMDATREANSGHLEALCHQLIMPIYIAPRVFVLTPKIQTGLTEIGLYYLVGICPC